jgi:hypothetical protein
VLAWLAAIQEQTALWAPASQPQWQAILSPADELFYGGSAGGGKSDLLLGLSISLHLDSLIFRREYAQMVGARGLIDRSRELVGNQGRYNGTEHVWRAIQGRRSLEFGSLPHEQSKFRYLGRPHDLLGFDEITEFSRTMYEFVIRWNRTTEPGQRCRVVATGNPPMHADGQWVIDYWGPWLDDKHPYPAAPGELRWYAMLDEKSVEVAGPAPFEHQGETVIPRSRTFIPARLSDNPYLGDDYRAMLQAAPEPLRSQLLYGSFTVGLADDDWQVIPTEWVRQAQARWTPQCQDLLDALGVDPARGGQDQTGIAERRGRWFSVTGYPGVTTPDGDAVAGLIGKHLLQGGTPAINIDVVGIGASVYDSARKLYKNVYAVNAGAGSPMRDRSGQFAMANVRAAYHWALREALEPGKGQGLALPPGARVLSDLTAARYSITAHGIQVEDKEAIKSRLGRSPDQGEALMLAHYRAEKRTTRMTVA